MDFGVMFFSSADPERSGEAYRLLVEAARFADANGFCAVWTPERHFHRFGGLFPNPSVVGAALAMITRRVEIRAGSLVSPLHDSIRVAEEWSVVDNLSGGRVAISFGSGWNVEDFVLQPDRYAVRHAVMYRQIEEIRTLWSGGRIARRGALGAEQQVEVFPRPVRRRLPVWLTSSGNVETFVSAGRIGANLLTHLLGQEIGELAEKIARYRQARAAGGLDPETGKVTLMLHTFLGDDADEVRRRVRQPFREYLRSAVSLERMAALAGGVISGGHRIEPHDIPTSTLEELLDLAFERYSESASLLGTPDACAERIWRLAEVGVDEIACLIDFIDDVEAVLGSLERVARLRAGFAPEGLRSAARRSMESFLEELET